MGLSYSLDIDLAPLKVVMGAYVTAGQDLTPLMHQFGALLEQSTKDRLQDTNEAPDGTPWPASMRASLTGGKTLVESGRLASSIQYVASADQVEVGTNVIYSSIHQTGGEIVPINGDALSFALPNGEWATVGKVTIPARPYLGVSQQDSDDLVQAATEYFEGLATP